MATVRSRVQPSDSRKAATLTSSMEMEDVSAAKKRTRKNAVAKIKPPGIAAKAVGRVVNASSAPTVGTRPNEKTTGNITMPDRRAMERSATVITSDDEGIPWSRLMYAPYVSRIPVPTEREKKACPKAAPHRRGSPSTEKSGVKKYPIASENPGSVTPYTASMTRITTETGIRLIDIRSIPFWTPRETTSPVTTAVTMKRNTGSHPEMNREKGTVLPASEKKVYPSVHPAITR